MPLKDETHEQHRLLEALAQQLADLGLVLALDLPAILESLGPETPSISEFLSALVRKGLVTPYQAQLLAVGSGSELVLGNYVILDKIGEGGMGQVFKARHRRMKRLVALKMLPSERVQSDLDVERFRREVEVVARLEHANIVTAYDADEWNGRHFLAMQYVDGADLASVVRACGPLNVAHAIGVLLQVVSGISYAHAKGIVHRDLKPGNLLVDRSGNVKVLDLGLARVAQDRIDAASLSANGTVVGTVDYMAPEQAADTRVADARSDVYSLGCTLFYLLAGEAPYVDGSLVTKLLAHRDQPLPDLREYRADVPDWLIRILKKMVAKQPIDRFQTMDELYGALQPHIHLSEQLQIEVDRLPPQASPGAPTLKWGQEPTSIRRKAAPSGEIMADGAPSIRGKREISGRRAVIAAFVALGLLGMATVLAVVLRVKTADGTLLVEVSDPNATLSVDGQPVRIEVQTNSGKTSLHVAVEPGTHKLVVTTKDGILVPLDRDTVTVEAGKETRIVARLQRSQPGGVEATPAAHHEETAETANPQTTANAKTRDRETTEWVLSVGGQAEIQDGKTLSKPKTVGMLPSSPFQLVSADNFPVEKVRDQDLIRFDGLLALKTLGLNLQTITDDELVSLQNLPALEVLKLQRLRATEKTIAALHRFPTLRVLEIGNFQPALLDDLVSVNLNLQTLAVILDRNATASRESVACLRQIAELKELRLTGKIENDALEEIGQIGSLRRFDIASPLITDEGVAKLTGLPALDSINLQSDHLSGATFAHLVKNCPDLTKIGFRGEKLTRADWGKLVALRRLARIDLRSSSYGDEAVEGLGQLKQLALIEVQQSPAQNQTKFTRNGISRLHAALPNCMIVSDFGTFGPGK
jgi:serine/threonine protein kinase